MGDKIKLPIVDNMISHCHTSSDRESPLMEWVRNDYNSYDFVFLTDTSLRVLETIKDKRCFAWLLESPAITKNYYEYVEKNHNRFDTIYTFKKDFIEKFQNSKFLPVGGCWIDNNDKGTHFDQKQKKLSIVASPKKQTEGHKLRHSVIGSYGDKIDLYGRGYNPIPNKIPSLKQYMYQIVIENTKEDYYFTEKLIDCLQTGVIPIYWGCPSIDKFFDINGIITFNNVDELGEIINNLSIDDYNNRKESIINNYEKSKEFLYSEHYLIKKYMGHDF
jgi:hypothetical protein